MALITSEMWLNAGLLTIPASAVSGWLLRTIGTRRSLFVGQARHFLPQQLTSNAAQKRAFWEKRLLTDPFNNK